MVQKVLTNISYKEYCEIFHMKYSTIVKEQPQKIYLPNYQDEYTNFNYTNIVIYPEINVYELINVNIIGANYIIFDEKNYCIYDLPLKDEEDKFDLRCNNTIYVDKKVTLIRYSEPIKTIEQGIMLISGCSFNFSHFYIDVLSKLCLINERSEYDNIPILVDEICLRIPQFLDALNLINKNKHEIIYVKNGNCYNIKKLIYISDLAIYPFELKKDYLIKNRDCVINDLGIKLLNKNLSLENKIFRKIFISRRNTFNPRLENQDAVEQIFIENGYEIIFPEEMSFKEQQQVFSEAKILAGVCGSAFTNIILTNKYTKIICIQSKSIEWTWFSNLAGILGRKYYFLDAKLSAETPYRYYQNKFKVYEDLLKLFLSHFE